MRLVRVCLKFILCYFTPSVSPWVQGEEVLSRIFLYLKEIQTGTIYSLPDFREGWGGYFIKILNSLIVILINFHFKQDVLHKWCVVIATWWIVIATWWVRSATWWVRSATWWIRSATWWVRLATWWVRSATWWVRSATWWVRLAEWWVRIATWWVRLAEWMVVPAKWIFAIINRRVG